MGEEATHFWLNSSWPLFSRERSVADGAAHCWDCWCWLAGGLSIKCTNLSLEDYDKISVT